MIILYYNKNENIYDFLNENQTIINDATLDSIEECLDNNII